MTQKPLITDFTAGELSPRMAGRVDLPIHAKGCSKLENWTPFLQGGVTTRPGLKHIGDIKSGATGVRLYAFNVSDTTGYILEMGIVAGTPNVAYLRFWKAASLGADPTLVMNGGNPLEFLSTVHDTTVVDFPYLASGEIDDVQFAQDGNALYMAHRNYAPRVLTWAGSGDSFTLATITMTGLSGSIPFHDTNNAWASSNYPGCVAVWGGRLWFASTITNPQTVWASEVWDPVNKYTHWHMFDTLSYVTRQPRVASLSFTGTTASGNATVTGISASDIAQMLVGDKITGAGIPAAATISVIGTSSITLSANATASATVTLVDAWSDKSVPEYGSATTTKDVTSDSNALEFIVGSDQCERIMFLAAGKDLIIGATVSEFIVPAGVTALNLEVRLQTRYGSSDIQGRLVNQAVVFVQGGATRLREYYYQNEQNAYQSPELTFQAEHILGTGIKNLDFAQSWQPMIYCVRLDGEMAVFVYSNTYGVQAWCRYVIDTTHTDKIESVAVIVDNDGSDNVYVLTYRGTTRRLERLDPLLAPVYNLDSYSIVTKGTTNTVLRFAGKTVYAVYQGVAYNCGVADGSGVFTIPTLTNGVSVGVGLLYTCEGITNRLSAGNGYTNRKRITKAVFMLLASYSFDAKSNKDYHEVSVTGPYSGDAEIELTGDWETQISLSFKQDWPLPVTILAISPEII